MATSYNNKIMDGKRTKLIIDPVVSWHNGMINLNDKTLYLLLGSHLGSLNLTDSRVEDELEDGCLLLNASVLWGNVNSKMLTF